MKIKVVNVIGIAVTLLLACMQSAIILWNYGRTGMGIYDPSSDLGEFSWSTIVGTDWLGWSMCTIGFSLLAIPWVQHLLFWGKHQGISKTLSGKSGFFHVLFTVFNIALMIGCLFLLIKGGDMHDMMFGYDRLMRVLEVSVLVYIPWSLFVFLKNLRRFMVTRKSGPQGQERSCNKVWHWVVSCLCFTMLGVYA